MIFFAVIQARNLQTSYGSSWKLSMKVSAVFCKRLRRAFITDSQPTSIVKPANDKLNCKRHSTKPSQKYILMMSIVPWCETRPEIMYFLRSVLLLLHGWIIHTHTEHTCIKTHVQKLDGWWIQDCYPFYYYFFTKALFSHFIF